MNERIGEYKLECFKKLMALGEKGNLWLVEDSVSGSRFVMREVSMESRPVYEKLAELRHEGIPEISDTFVYGGFLYVVEEYLEWKLLSEAAAQKPFSARQVYSVGRQILDVLMVLHKQGIVHRDIKPENIMIDDHGRVKLIDFDIARLFAREKGADTTVKGSRDYAPPEQFGFAQSDPRADLYSLGVTLNELAVGALPEQKRCKGTLGTFIGRCTEFDPKRRYQSAEVALRHLKRLEKRALWRIFGMSCFLLIFLAAGTALLFFGRKEEGEGRADAGSDLGERAEPGYRETTAPPAESTRAPGMEKGFTEAEYPDRIIFVQDPDRYPAFLMTEDGICESRADLGKGLNVYLSAEKSGEKLSLSLQSPDGAVSEFVFADEGRELYTQQAEGLETELEGKIPEYEILLADINGDGVKELFVTFARRRRIDTPDQENRYYLTAYALLWVIYQTEPDGWACSEMLFCSDYGPKLEQNGLLFNYASLEFYTFENGIWKVN